MKALKVMGVFLVVVAICVGLVGFSPAVWGDVIVPPCPTTPAGAHDTFGGSAERWGRLNEPGCGWGFGYIENQKETLTVPSGYFATWWDAGNHRREGPGCEVTDNGTLWFE